MFNRTMKLRKSPSPTCSSTIIGADSISQTQSTDSSSQGSMVTISRHNATTTAAASPTSSSYPSCSPRNTTNTRYPTSSRQYSPTTSAAGRRLFLNTIVACAILTGLLLTVEVGTNMKRSLRMNHPTWLYKDQDDTLPNEPYMDDAYHPFYPHHTFHHNCDVLPLTNGHNVWHEETSEAIRLHKHSSEICGPKVVVVGSMKCGTNTLGHLLAKHPRVKINTCPLGRLVESKETGCNDQAFQGRIDDIWEGNDASFHKNQYPENSTEWLEHWTHRLPWTDGIHNITIDKSPSYLNVLEFPNITHDLKRLLPNAKIAVSVCDPSLRLFSEYNHNMDQRPEGFLQFYKNKGVDVPSDFSSFVDLLFQDAETLEACQQFPNFCERNKVFYLKKGEYTTHIKAWMDVFGKENVMVVDMHENQATVAQKLLDLVGHDILPPKEYPWHEVKKRKEIDFKSVAANYTGRASAYHEYPSEIVRLEQHYSQFNTELAHMLGEDFPLQWNQRLKDAVLRAREDAKKQKAETRRQRRERERLEQQQRQ